MYDITEAKRLADAEALRRFSHGHERQRAIDDVLALISQQEGKP